MAAGLAALTLASSYTATVDAEAAEELAAASGPVAGSVRGSYSGSIRHSNGRLDVPANMDSLKRLNVNMYLYSVQSGGDWEDLTAFAAAAQENDIEVWVSLLPPSSCPGLPERSCSAYEPYERDYVTWVTRIAELSVRFPRVAGWSIDDFDTPRNLDHFTPALVRQMHSASRAIRPSLQFHPVVYHSGITQSFVDRYGPLMDGLIMPFRDDPHQNSQWTDSLPAHLDNARALLAPHGVQLTLMPYVWHFGGAPVYPDVDYVERVMTIGMRYVRERKILGVIPYGTPLKSTGGQGGARNYSHDSGSGALVAAVSAVGRSAGDRGGAKSTVRRLPGATSCRMSFWHADNRTPPTPSGLHKKRVLLGNTVVWEADVASDGADWNFSGWIDLPHMSSSPSAQLSLEMYLSDGSQINQVITRFDDLAFEGCAVDDPSFETRTSWTSYRVGGPVVASIHIFDPNYRTSVFNLIADKYITG